ncbi:MAG TPA: polysaccharide deacetylase family protein [Actinomycetes bacterium]|jgi:peptidoglycan/xylan/chitin deacetylase (PgdA/CDA1 family)|nr:polysaccharide deacetylase family protein [Actinomycetes bacterium]
MRSTARGGAPQLQLRSRIRLWLAATGALAVFLSGWAVSPTPAAAATASTVVTIGFDDGTTDQLGALPILQAHGMTATFFVNSASVGDAEHLSWADLHTLFDAGNEIAGHTLHHVNLTPLTAAEARQEVCTDRNNLLAAGFPATSFAYPFGSFDSGTELVVHDCGYNSGRGVSGVSKTGPFAETIPPLDPYATRTPPNPKKATKLSTLELYVLNAEANGGGWVQFVFHRVCEQCGPYAITPGKLTAFLDFLQGEVTGGRVVVQTTAQVIGGPVQPPVPA